LGRESRAKEKVTDDPGRGNNHAEARDSKKIEKSSATLPSEKFHDFPVVGIGASAGGLEAFTALLENVPAETGMAFIFIQHLASGESMLTDILQRSTSLPVHTVKNNMMVEMNNVYVIPPDTSMTIFQGALYLQRRVSTQYKPIDEFLVSLAQDKKNLSIGIILSGTGTDGTEGLKAIYEEGGITFAQEETTAKYQGMPHSAVSSGAVAFILPPKEIAKELVRISRHPGLNHVEVVPAEKPEAPTGENNIRSIFSLLRLRFHVDFNNYKSSTINRRISRRMVINKLESIGDYLKLLRKNDEELRALFDDMLISVTSFFREPETFQYLTNVVFPEITKNREPERSIRIWVPGCSSGEEVYSIAICLREYFEKANVNVPVQIFGTDINDRNIEKARAGVYPDSIAAEVSEARLGRYFNRVDRGYQIITALRDMCIFAKQDLTTDPPFSNLDIVSCRNVLIYFKPELQKRILPIFHYALKPYGYLVLGISESIGNLEDLFSTVDGKRAPIYIRKLGPTKITFGTEPTFDVISRGETKKPISERPLVSVQKETDQYMMSRYVPPSVVVDEDMNILLFRGDTGPFLNHMPGEASFNLTKVVRNELKLDVQTSFYSAKKQGKPIRREGVEFKSNSHTRLVNIEVVPLKLSESDRRLFMIVFDEASPLLAVPQKISKRSKAAEESLKDRQIKEMSNELASTKESLQTIIEEQESTNEEMRSALEEVQSSNEELQSTNEELETAKEELQSTNEELNTLNEELANRNRDISRSMNDLNNVFNNTNMAIIILDTELKIRLFTPQTGKLFNLIPSDVSRPLNDLRLGLKIPDFLKTVKHVIEDVVVYDNEVQAEDGKWYLMRIRPYLTIEKRIDGAVLSFVDITDLVRNRILEGEVTERKRSEEQLRSSALYARNLIDTTRDPLIAVDTQGMITDVNKATESATGVSRDLIIGTDFTSYFAQPSKARDAYQRALREGSVKDSPLAIKHASGKTTEIMLDATVSRDKEGRVQGIFAAGRVVDGLQSEVS
jgi:two-component system, chemotaxis family, CheB/CheR fusion protein